MKQTLIFTRIVYPIQSGHESTLFKSFDEVEEWGSCRGNKVLFRKEDLVLIQSVPSMEDTQFMPMVPLIREYYLGYVNSEHLDEEDDVEDTNGKRN